MGFSAFHEGRGVGKTDSPGGHIIVSGKNSYRKKGSYRKRIIGKRNPLLAWANRGRKRSLERDGMRGFEVGRGLSC